MVQAEASRRSVLTRWLGSERAPSWGADPDAWDPDALRRMEPGFSSVFGPGRYLRVTVRGWEHLPDAPAYIVGNHSGGTTVLDAMGFGWAWYTHLGYERPLHPLVHELLFTAPALGRAVSQIGCLRASRHNARRVLEELGRDALVYPGGDQDTWRPWRRRYEVTFAGRRGYARLALELGQPIVPLAHAGAQQSHLVLSTGRPLARALGIHRLARAEVFPIHLSLPWGLTAGPWPHLPLPVGFDYRFGPAVDFPPGYRRGRAITSSMVDRYDQAVRTSLQGLLDQLRADRTKRRRRRLQRAQATVKEWMTRAR